MQLSGLVLSPHVVYGGYGRAPDADLTDRLITGGVDTFLARYRTPSADRRRLVPRVDLARESCFSR